MDRGMQSIVIGIVFIIIAIVFIYIQKGINIWTGLIIVLSILNIITGIIRKNK